MTENQTFPTRNNSIDALKLFATLLVVWLHYGVIQHDCVPERIITYTLNALCRLAVPVFFIITGYYYPLLRDYGRVPRYLTKLLWLSLFATAIYVSLHLFVDKDPWINLRFSRFINFLLFNDTVYGFHLWYLFAVVYAVAIMYLIDSYYPHHITTLYKVGLTLFIIGLIIRFIHMPGYYTRNFLTFGLPYILAGRFIREQSQTPPPTTILLIVISLISLVSILAESLLLSTPDKFWSRDNYFFLLPFAVSVFLLFQRIPATSPAIKTAATIGRRYSAYIYIFHVAIAIVIEQILICDLNPWTRPLIIFATSLVIAVIYVETKRLLSSNTKKRNFNS